MAYRSYECQECGCRCDNCSITNSLNQEIDDLKRQVRDRDLHITRMETNVLSNMERFPNGEFAALSDELLHLQDRYERLLENHRKLQRVNQGLEDKLLKIVDKYETEKNSLNRDIANLTTKLVEAKLLVTQLEEENEQYRNDCNVAINLLQCKPSNFVSQRLETFPVELQHKARVHLNSKKFDNSNNHPPPEMRTIRVNIPTFPPTAMVYSVSNGYTGESIKNSSSNGELGSSPNSSDVVSAAIMAKVLEEREKERSANGNKCCCCAKGEQSGRCGCKCRGRRWSSSWPDVQDNASQTLWSIPVDTITNTWNLNFPSSPFSLKLPTAAVHQQRKLPVIISDNGEQSRFNNLGTSGTETEI
ncbi:Tight junction associated protein 1 (Peripheral) [Chamberlinius hualienensis]